MKTTTRLIGVVAIAMVLSIASSGVALACCPVPETECTVRFDTVTDITCRGTVIEDESLIYDQASMDLAALPPLDDDGELYSNTRYSESMIARDGRIDFAKNFDFDSDDSAGRPDYNLEVAKTFDYVANAAGGLIYSESVAIDAISMFQDDAAVMCPFALPGDELPESCEYVEAGSTLDVTQASVTTRTRTITTAMSTDTTPILMHYEIAAGDTLLTPGVTGAVGSATAFMNVHDMEGRDEGELGVEIEFAEMTTVRGIFDLSKTMDYESGILHP